MRKELLPVDSLLCRHPLRILAFMALGFATLILYNHSNTTPASTPIQHSDVIVLLAGNYEERSPVAASLFLAGYAPRILLTDDGVRRGWSDEHQRSLYTVERTEIELMKLGVPRHAIVRLPFKKSGTVFDALAVRNYILHEKLDSLIIVTSDYHSRRALWVFKRIFKGNPIRINIVSAPSHSALISKQILECLKYIFNWMRFPFIPLE